MVRMVPCSTGSNSYANLNANHNIRAFNDVCNSTCIICMSNSTGNRAIGINSTSNVIEIARGEAECYFNCFTSAIGP